MDTGIGTNEAVDSQAGLGRVKNIIASQIALHNGPAPTHTSVAAE